MKIYNWKEIELETGINYNRIRYALEQKRIELPRTEANYTVTDEGLLTIIRHFRGMPKHTHFVKKADEK